MATAVLVAEPGQCDSTEEPTALPLWVLTFLLFQCLRTCVINPRVHVKTLKTALTVCLTFYSASFF
jgi:uncharacterized membrane protein YadS